MSFPFLMEPQLATRQQAFTWSGGYVVFALICAFTAWVSREVRADTRLQKTTAPYSSKRPPNLSERPGVWQLLFWVLLATCASVLLVSVSNHMSRNVAPIPLLWVLPLALYLLTFIFAFESDRIYRRRLFIPLLAPALASMAYMIYVEKGNLNIKFVVPGFAASLFIAACFAMASWLEGVPRPLI